MKTNINLNKWMDLFIEKILDHTVYLNGLDTAIGDGDHGDNMKNGVLKLESYIQMHLESSDRKIEDPKELLNIMSVLFLSNIEGASGPLYAAAFKNMAEIWENDGVPLNEIIQAGSEGIKRLGHAEVGEKTMLDVWCGVYELIENNMLTIDNVQKEVLFTKDKEAKKGRASYFGERSIGHIDPGAQSSGYFFEAMIEALEV